MKWQDEFGSDYAVPAWISERYFDMSWHNDASPSFLVWGSDVDNCIRLWVEHPDPAMREVGDHRFTVASYDCSDWHQELFAGDDEDALRTFLATLPA